MIRRQSCPICETELPLNAASELATFPFCSQRCRQVDLYRWSTGRYAIAEPIDPGELSAELNDGIDGEDE